jgi:hypothetical protein
MNREDIARRAASALKMIRLARMPEMDPIAVQLNAGPTHEEVAEALRWMLALELAADESITTARLIARKILEQGK